MELLESNIDLKYFPGCLNPNNSNRIIIAREKQNIHMSYKKLNGEMQHLNFIREQFYIIPAYSFTIYKSQGQTLKQILFILKGLTMKEKITVFSRVKDWNNLMILDKEDFKKEDIISKINDGSIEEYKRLQKLSVKTNKEIWKLFPDQLYNLFKEFDKFE